MSPKLLNILLIVTSVVLYIYVISPIYSGGDSIFFEQGQDIKGLIDTRNSHDKVIEIIPSIIKQANDLKVKYESIAPEDREKILTMVPVSVNEIKLMSEIVNIAAESGVPIEDMGIRDKGGEYTVSFVVNTTYSNFKKIITYWENNRRLFTLQSVNFSPGKTEEDNIEFKISFSTYYMK